MEKSKFKQPQAHQIQTYNHIDDKLPIDNSQRKCTDILCIIIGVGLTVALGVLSIVMFNQQNYLKQVFPADTDGFTCGYEYPGYNFLYFAKPNDLTNRVCVKYCPKSQSDGIACKKTKSLECKFGSAIQYYPTETVINDYGQFCLPKDESARANLEDKMKSHSRNLYYNSVKTIGRALVITAIASVIFMLLVQIIPKVMFWVSIVLGIVGLLGLALTIILYPSNVGSMSRMIVFIFAVVIFLILVITIIGNLSHLKYNLVFLQHSTKFVCARLYTFVLPIVFIILGAGFFFIQILQYRSFWSYGNLKFEPATDLYHKPQSPTGNFILTVLQIIQIIWGTFFLKQAFNYLISAEAVQWYHGKGSACCNGVFTLVFKHLGSVIACAFMNAFFGVLDFILDTIIPDVQNSTNFCGQCVGSFAAFFDLVRSDALTFVYLTGQAYCNSARYCDYIVNKSQITQNSQGLNRIYRLTSHFAIAGVMSILSFWVISKGSQVSITAMFILLLLSLGVCTFFVSLHADAAQSIAILYLTETQFAYQRGFGERTSEFKDIHQKIQEQRNPKENIQ